MQKQIRRYVSLLICALLTGGLVLLGGSFPVAAGSGQTFGPITDQQTAASTAFVSPMTNLYTPGGLHGGQVAAHGGGQTRMVSVSSGAYYALNAGNHEFKEGDRTPVSLIRMAPDGTASIIYQDYIRYYNSGPTVVVLADKNEDIWMYAGIEEEFNDTFTFILWHYEVKTGRVTQYSSMQRELCIEGGYGYSTAYIDPEREIILATTPGADAPGYLMWSVFDMKTLTWGQAVAAKLQYRNAYTFGFPDGNGGFYIINQRDLMTSTVKTDLGISVEQAQRTYHSWKISNNMLFDQWLLGHIKDPAVPEIDYISVEDPEYQVLLGLYPEFITVCADPLIDSRGYLHFVYIADDQGEAGYTFTHVIYDTNDNLREIARHPVRLLTGEHARASVRLFEDTKGNIYLLSMPQAGDAQWLEIWQLPERSGEFRLVWWHDFGTYYSPGYFCQLIIANARGNSTPSDTAYCGVNINYGAWQGFTVDFAALRQQLLTDQHPAS